LKWLTQQLSTPNVEFCPGSIVKRVEWKPRSVKITAQTTDGEREYQAQRIVITLPLGVLKHSGPGAVVFNPPLRDKQQAIEGLEMGAVVKLNLIFREQFWPIKDFGFIVADEALFPTWWSHAGRPMLTAWAGGRRAVRLSRFDREALLEEALKNLSSFFRIAKRELGGLLVDAYVHDWNDDPFSHGAYSFTPTHMTQMPQRLAAPIAGTLFFAGEATNAEGEQGTVQAALSSGQRAADELLRSLA
jgi:monoamine oxidase